MFEKEWRAHRQFVWLPVWKPHAPEVRRNDRPLPADAPSISSARTLQTGGVSRCQADSAFQLPGAFRMVGVAVAAARASARTQVHHAASPGPAGPHGDAGDNLARNLGRTTGQTPNLVPIPPGVGPDQFLEGLAAGIAEKIMEGHHVSPLPPLRNVVRKRGGFVRGQ